MRWVPRIRVPRGALTGGVAGGLTALTALTALTGCGGGDPAPVPVTVTVTVTPTATRSPRPAQTEPPGLPIGDRAYDVGTVVGSRGTGDERILLFDRWSVAGIDDAQVARDGIPVRPELQDRFANENDTRIYAVPLAEDAHVVINECLPPADPAVGPGMQSRPATVEEFLRLPGRDRMVALLTYDSGRMVTLATSPRCPENLTPSPTTPPPPTTPPARRPGR